VIRVVITIRSVNGWVINRYGSGILRSSCCQWVLSIVIGISWSDDGIVGEIGSGVSGGLWVSGVVIHIVGTDMGAVGQPWSGVSSSVGMFRVKVEVTGVDHGSVFERNSGSIRVIIITSENFVNKGVGSGVSNGSGSSGPSRVEVWITGLNSLVENQSSSVPGKSRSSGALRIIFVIIHIYH